MTALQLLAEADNHLNEVEVRRESVTHLDQARRLLKLVYDQIKNPPKTEAKEE